MFNLIKWAAESILREKPSTLKGRFNFQLPDFLTSSERARMFPSEPGSLNK